MPVYVCVLCSLSVLWHKQTHGDAQLIICGCMLYTMSEVKARSSLDVLPAWVRAGVCLTSIVRTTTIRIEVYPSHCIDSLVKFSDSQHV